MKTEEPVSKAPASTYRIQLSPAFTFRDLGAVTDYLSELGIDAIYASPVMEAVSGSTHGYDVISFSEVRRELGGESEFIQLLEKVRTAGLGWVQDFVPNHMAFSYENRWLSDVLLKGRDSKYSAYFDIEWDHPSPFLRGKVLAPFLASDYLEQLNDGKISFDDGMIDCSGMLMPCTAPHTAASSALQIHEILQRQHYLLRCHLSASSEINYRRFFAVNNLIAVRPEHDGCFTDMHEKILHIVNKGLISSLRIDHIDGLYDPRSYLERLHEATNVRPFVEKIIGEGETLCDEWLIAGTTGYDFLSMCNSLFVDWDGARRIQSAYSSMTGRRIGAGVIRKLKREICFRFFRGDFDRVAFRMLAELRSAPYFTEVGLHELSDLLIDIACAMDVYRTYVSESSASPRDIGTLSNALQKAMRGLHRKQLTQAFRMLIASARSDVRARRALMHFQQLTPAVYAKAVEDTLFFRYCPLISLNEVGCTSLLRTHGMRIGRFHNFILQRVSKFPYAMNATSTHDTKYGEDFRYRIDTLSEIPSRWLQHFKNFRAMNESKAGTLKRRPAVADEYYLYQLLIGLGANDRNVEALSDRIKSQMVKYLREGKLLSSWRKPDTEYETTVIEFVDRVISDSEFMKSFDELSSFLSYHGMIKSISSLLLKIGCPGTPDFYQGSEALCLNMTDPDNRRPVDFHTLRERLHLALQKGSGYAGLARMLESGMYEELKLFVTAAALRLRKAHRGLFMEGRYVPLSVSGDKGRFIAFARLKGKQAAVFLLPLLTVSTAQPSMLVEERAFLLLRGLETVNTLRSVFTGKEIETGHTSKLKLSELVSDVPWFFGMSGETDD